MILSMTPRSAPARTLINGSRRKRIAAGLGHERRRPSSSLVKQFDQMRKMMKQLASGKMPNPAALLRGGRRRPRRTVSGPFPWR